MPPEREREKIIFSIAADTDANGQPNCLHIELVGALHTMSAMIAATMDSRDDVFTIITLAVAMRDMHQKKKT